MVLLVWQRAANQGTGSELPQRAWGGGSLGQIDDHTSFLLFLYFFVSEFSSV